MRRHLHWTLLLALIGLLVAPSALADSIERVVDLQPGGILRISSEVGSVEIVGHDGSKASLTISSAKDLEEHFDIAISEGARELTIQIDKKGSWSWTSWWGDSSGKLRIAVEVPRETSIEVGTGGGSITLAELDGSVDVKTSGGSISAESIAGTFKARTSGGGIELENIDAEASVNTSGGQIVARGVTGALTARTSGGSLSIEDIGGDLVAITSGGGIKIREAAGRVEAKTAGGSIYCRLAAGNNEPVSLRTSAGTIRVQIDPSSSYTIDAATSVGSVDTDLPVSREGGSSRTRLRGELNGGGPELTAKTSAGSVTIESR